MVRPSRAPGTSYINLGEFFRYFCLMGIEQVRNRSERSLRKGNGNPLQYSCLENHMDRGAWWATAHGVAKGQTRLNMHMLCSQNE